MSAIVLMSFQVSFGDELEKDTSAMALFLDEALTRLATIDERKARIVELRYFSGLSVEETAEVLGVSMKIKRTPLYRYLRKDLFVSPPVQLYNSDKCFYIKIIIKKAFGGQRF